MTASNQSLYRNLAKAVAAAPTQGASTLADDVTGVITAVSIASGTPSVTVQIAGDTTQVSGIAFLDSYTPVVGDTCVLHHQGAVYWATGRMANGAGTGPALGLPLVGRGQYKNVLSGGSDRSSTWPFHFTDFANIPVSGGAWAYDTTGRLDESFSGCGSFHVTPGGDSSSLGFLTVLAASCSISGGVLFLGGLAQNYNGANIASGTITINVSAIGW